MTAVNLEGIVVLHFHVSIAYRIVSSASTPNRDDLIYARHYEMLATNPSATEYLMGTLGSVDTVSLAPHDAQRLTYWLSDQRV
jgi:hypothetical protein